jgi:hypothetical protein
MKNSDKALLGLLALAIVFVGAGLILPMLAKVKPKPPLSVQREQQRKEVFNRIEAAGGWEVLRSECLSLLTSNSNHFFWRPADRVVAGAGTANSYVTNIDYGPLPPALTNLKPREVRVTRTDPPILQIHVFGHRRTGGGTPYYYIYIVGGAGSEDFTPELDFGPSDLLLGAMRRITNSVFELY